VAREVPDVPADNPVGTMARFADGLRRVLAVPKQPRVVGTRTTRKPKEADS